MTGQCDCCGKDGELAFIIAYGIETYACAKCRGIEENPEPNEHVAEPFRSILNSFQ